MEIRLLQKLTLSIKLIHQSSLTSAFRESAHLPNIPLYPIFHLLQIGSAILKSALFDVPIVRKQLKRAHMSKFNILESLFSIISFIRQSSCLNRKSQFIYRFICLLMYLFAYDSIYLFVIISRKKSDYDIRFSLRNSFNCINILNDFNFQCTVFIYVIHFSQHGNAT